jgi:3-oxoacyl-[acyl-carrier protein] reductase
LADAGAAVVVNYASSKAGADAVVAEITTKGGKAVAVQADVAKKVDIERLFTETNQAFGGLDILVNNAGVYEFLPLEAVTEEHFHRLFDPNVLGLILCSQEAVDRFGADGGSIINISSVASTSAPPTGSVYSATKAAVDAVTKSLAKELGPRNIRVNAINPGMVETEGVHAAGIAESDFRKQSRRKRRWAASDNRKTLLGPQFSSPPKVRPGSPGKPSSSRVVFANCTGKTLKENCAHHWSKQRLRILHSLTFVKKGLAGC